MSAERALRLIALVVLSAWLGVAPSGCSKGPEIAELPPPEVSVSQPISREESESFETTGRTQAVESVDVRARVSGYLVKVDFQEGNLVTANQVLYQIDPRPYEADVSRTEGALARWHASLLKAKADVQRAQNLLPRGAASQSDLDAAVASRDTSIAEIQSAEAQLAQAKLDLEFTRVTSPIDGRVGKTNLTVGNLVQAGTTGSDPLTTVVSVSPIYVYFDIDERTLLTAIAAQQERTGRGPAPERIRDAEIPIEIGLANEQGTPHVGVLDFVDNRVDASTGTLKARATFENTDRRLIPGLFVRLRMPLGAPEPTLMVTDRAIGTDQGNKYVLVVNDNDVVEYRRVELGPTMPGGLRVVRTGLEPGEWMVTNGLQRIRPGMTVKPQKTDMVPKQEAKTAAAAPAAAPAPAAAAGEAEH